MRDPEMGLCCLSANAKGPVRGPWFLCCVVLWRGGEGPGDGRGQSPSPTGVYREKGGPYGMFYR